MRFPTYRHVSQAVLRQLVYRAFLPLLLLAGMNRTAGAQTAQAGGTITLVGGLYYSRSTAVDGAGNLYLTDPLHNAVMEVPLGCSSYNCVITLGGGFYVPTGVAVDGSGNVYVATFENNAVKQMTPRCSNSSCVITLGGGFYKPFGLAVDTSGNVYVADSGNSSAKKITPGCSSSSCVTTLGGGFSHPSGVAVDGSGNVYVADSYNSALKEMTPRCSRSSCVTVLSEDFRYPAGVAVDGSGNVYVTDTNRKSMAVKVIVRGALNFHSVNIGSTSLTVAVPFQITGNGTFGTPNVLTQGAAGLDFAYVSGGSNCSGALIGGTTCTVNVRLTPKVAGSRMGAVELVSSTGTILATEYINGTGVGPQVTFQRPGQTPVTLGGGYFYPRGVAVDGSGNVYIADTLHNAVKKMTPGCSNSSCVITLGGGFNTPYSVAVDGGGNVYVADTRNNAVKMIPPGCLSSSCVTTLGGGFTLPGAVAVDGNGNVYVADNNHNSVKVMTPGCNSSSCVTSLGGGISVNWGIAVDGSGNVYVADYFNNAVKKMTPGCTSASCVTTLGGGFSSPYGVAVDAGGNVYVTDYGHNVVKEITPGCSSSSCVTTLTGGFSIPTSIALDGIGNVYVTDTLNNRLKELTFATPPSLSFPTATPFGSTDSTDGRQMLIVANIGNGGLVLPPPLTGTNAGIAAGFTLGSTGTCPQLSLNSSPYTLAAGSNCTYQIGFAPTRAGTNSGSLLLTDNTLNAIGSTQTIALSGTGTKATPTITWATPSAISYGTALGGQQLNATASVAGSFLYSPAAGPLALGPHTLSVTFTPMDTVDYTTATASVILTITKATPTITWATPAPISYGTPLGKAQLNAGTVAAGQFSYSPALGRTLGAGSHILRVSFFPTDTTDYAYATGSVTLTVTPGTPTITTLPTASALTYGQTLASSSLQGGVASTAGIFVWTTPTLVPSRGTASYSVTFTPSDNANYSTTTTKVPVLTN